MAKQMTRYELDDEVRKLKEEFGKPQTPEGRAALYRRAKELNEAAAKMAAEQKQLMKNARGIVKRMKR